MRQTTKNQLFSEADREIFQLLIRHKLEPHTVLAKYSGESVISTFTRRINNFCEKYRCSEKIQVLHWDLLGLEPFFLLTDKPFRNPYVIREYKMLGDGYRYLTQCIAPNLNIIRGQFRPDELYPIATVYPPTNDIRLLYKEAHDELTFIDRWLLNLKEVMVDQELGSVVQYREEIPQSMIEVSNEFLIRLKEIYTRKEPGRFRQKGRRSKQIDFIKDLSGFLSVYLDIKIPGMEDYILILKDINNPELFVGGFLGHFPLLELYETTNPITLICRFQIPEQNFTKFHLNLFTHLTLTKACFPSLWILEEDTRFFHLEEQWDGKRWIPFEL
ncbi:MAG: hypothetical protein ACTSYB_12570 [Candidatus Helarchaeota archaeon]